MRTSLKKTTTDTGELSIGAIGPVTGIVGDSGEYEHVATVGVGDLSSSTTTSTDWTQPYSNEYRQVLPNSSIADVTGTGGLYGSLLGRLTVVDNSTGEVASIRIENIKK